jgi:hypothetical protein
MRLLPLLALFACAGKEEDSGDPPDLVLDDTGETCSTVAPVIESVTLTNAGMRDFEEGSYAAWEIAIAATDADSDLNLITADLWWDTPPDGTVDTSRTPDVEGDTILTRDEPCRVERATYYFYVRITDTSALLPSTEYEVAGVLQDAAGLASEPVIGTGWTPDVDGTDGGPQWAATPTRTPASTSRPATRWSTASSGTSAAPTAPRSWATSAASAACSRSWGATAIRCW